MRSAVIGASAGLGRALAEELAASGHDLYLVATDARDLQATASDLRIRFGRKVVFLAADIRKVSAADIRKSCHDQLGSPDCLFLISGQADIERDFEKLSEAEIQQLIEVNLAAPVRLATAFLPDLIASKQGACVGIGSVAQARPRAKNSVYASSKQGLEFFFGGLRHRLAETACRVQYYRVGYMATSMMFGRESLIPSASTSRVAKVIAHGLHRDRIGSYIPWWWRFVMLAFRSLPWFVFRKFKG
jgi:decaprenylphospho-beta-D-erythro-pentofuranosid-2-ulose 2-reductase